MNPFTRCVVCVPTCRHLSTLATVTGGAVVACQAVESDRDFKAEELSAQFFYGRPVFMSVNGAAWSAIGTHSPLWNRESSSSGPPPDARGTTFALYLPNYCVQCVFLLVCLIDYNGPLCWFLPAPGIFQSSILLLGWQCYLMSSISVFPCAGMPPLAPGAWFRQCKWSFM